MLKGDEEDVRSSLPTEEALLFVLREILTVLASFVPSPFVLSVICRAVWHDKKALLQRTQSRDCLCRIWSYVSCIQRNLASVGRPFHDDMDEL